MVENGSGWRRWAPPLAVLAIATLVRAWHLTSWDFWTDEIHTLSIASTGEWSFGPAYITAPINFVLTSLSIEAFGLNELGGRFVPFVAGIATVWLTYALGRRWVGERAALVGQIVVALSFWHVYWSQNARHFSIQSMFILIGLHWLLVAWTDDQRRAPWIAALSFIGALAVHSSSVFFLGAGLVFVVGVSLLRYMGFWYDQQRPLRRHLRALAGLLCVLLAFIPVSIWVGQYLAETVVPWNSLSNLVGSLVFYIPPYIALAAVAGALILLRERDDVGTALAAFVVVPVILLVIASRLTIASAPYVLSIVIPIGWLVGVAIDRLMGMTADLRWAVAFVAAGVFLGQGWDLALYHTEYRGLKPRWREAAEFVAANRQEGDVIAATEADVIAHYIGWEGVEWFGRAEALRDEGEFPPEGARGVWYVAYTADRVLISDNADARQRALNAGFRTLLPMHYGPKDRTLGVFYERLDADR